MSEKREEQAFKRERVRTERIEFTVARLSGILSAIVGPMAHGQLLADHVTLEANGACALADDLLRDMGTPGENFTERLRYVLDREVRKAELNGGRVADAPPAILGANGKPVPRG